MSSLVPRFAVFLTVAFGLAVVPAAPADVPQGQFRPAPDDRDGDGVADTADCAPDDPSRPARDGQDADCDGVADAGAYSADSSAPIAAGTLRSAARAAARVPVVAVPGTALGPAVVFRPRQPRPLLVFAAREAMRVTATPILFFADGRRVEAPKSWSQVARGAAWAMRVRPSDAQRVALSITIRDSAGATFSTTRTIYRAAG